MRATARTRLVINYYDRNSQLVQQDSQLAGETRNTDIPTGARERGIRPAAVPHFLAARVILVFRPCRLLRTRITVCGAIAAKMRE